MPARGVTDTHLVIGAGVVTVLLGGAAAFIEPPGGAGVETSSSFNAGAPGGKAAFQTLKELGYPVERSFEPMTAIRAEPRRTTLVLTGTIGPSEQDRRALQTFLEAGGVALLVGAQGADFLRVGGVKAASFSRPATHRVMAPSALAANVTEISMTRGAGTPKFGPSHVAVFSVAGGEPLVSTARVGAGRVIWWAAATPLANAHISSADNLQLLVNVAGAPGARDVLWDEHYHGHTRSLWSYAAETPLPWIAGQIAIVALAACAAYSRRRGPVRAKFVDARTSPMEFIDMLRALYERAGAPGAAVAAARTRFTRAVTAACGIPADSTDDALARAAASKIRVDVQQVADLLAASDRGFRDPDLSAAEALTLTQGLQRLSGKFQGSGF
ncbi:MAG TPA: DUF4350 domain-containing protein [Vicinamibacterales bacterium]|nr:DUF4350 domain-containing protein [Vicinamibacterales bacterium]